MKPLVLVVDDDEPMRDLVKSLLELNGYEVATAWSGEHALKYLILGRPAMMIFDLQMPGMSGLELMQRVRLRRHFTETPVMMLTASGLGVDIQACIRSGASAYLLKPFSPNELLDRVGAMALSLANASARADEDPASLTAQAQLRTG